jgi:hypothetical protein
MQVTASGWARNRGERVLLQADVAHMEVWPNVELYERGEKYLEVKMEQGTRGMRATIRASGHAELNLNGSYLIQVELSREEIERLFYLTNGDRAIPKLLEMFENLRKQEVLGLRVPNTEAAEE